MTTEPNVAREEPTLAETQQSPPAEAAPSATPSTQSPARRDWTRHAVPILASSLVTLAVLSPLIYTSVARRPAPVATVDLQSLVEAAQARQLAAFRASNGAQAAPSASDAQAAVDDTARFARELSVAVDALGRNCRCVLVNKAAILNTDTVVDYTDVLRTQFRLETSTGVRK
ncbi:hypothetical protein [Burkholderia cepacia]|uniref:hypothetical protein n=1 Tax=Burkholderia cepacia TaxID=292 RepID=UPI0007C6F266|nr:hypothetical protein [Burkholderia cepacia]